jgi:hypothetical protein
MSRITRLIVEAAGVVVVDSCAVCMPLAVLLGVKRMDRILVARIVCQLAAVEMVTAEMGAVVVVVEDEMMRRT